MSEMNGRLVTAKSALDFMLAGNATVTLRSRLTETRYTFHVKASKNPERKGQLYVSVLSGPDNTSDYVYLGMVQNKQFRLTRASKMNAESIPVKAFSWTFAMLEKGIMPEQVEIWHEGRCGRCGRKLTVPESVSSGFGPECINHV